MSNPSLVRSLCAFKACSWAHWWNVEDSSSQSHHKEKHKTVTALFASMDMVFCVCSKSYRKFREVTSIPHGWIVLESEAWVDWVERGPGTTMLNLSSDSSHHVHLLWPVLFLYATPDSPGAAGGISHEWHRTLSCGNLKQKGGSGRGIVKLLR